MPVQVLRANAARVHRQGSFQIRRVRPGLVLGPTADPAFGPLSVIDHAHLEVGTTVKMHEHINDEILTYLRSGDMVHTDSAGHQVALSRDRLMLMNAGRSFWHEESVLKKPVEALQIFVRPREADLPGTVQFYERPKIEDASEWRLIGGPENSPAPLKIRQQVLVYDARTAPGQVMHVPTVEGFAPWLYVMDGAIQMGGLHLTKGDAAANIAAPLPPIHAGASATLVLFLVDRNAQAVRDGTISGM